MYLENSKGLENQAHTLKEVEVFALIVTGM
jgi:hypothetical protein